jgi:hypothetical protein
LALDPFASTTLRHLHLQITTIEFSSLEYPERGTSIAIANELDKGPPFAIVLFDIVCDRAPDFYDGHHLLHEGFELICRGVGWNVAKPQGDDVFSIWTNGRAGALLSLRQIGYIDHLVAVTWKLDGLPRG